MALLAQRDFEHLMDSVAAQIVEALKVFDNDGVLVNSFTFGALSNVNRIAALVDAEQKDVLFPGARYAFNMSRAFPLIYKLCFALMKAVEEHFKKYGYRGIDDYLTGVDTRVAPETNHAKYATLGRYLTPANVWPPVQDDMGVFNTVGPGVGNFLDGSVIDGRRYGGGDLVIENTGILPITCTYHISLTREDLAPEMRDVICLALGVGLRLDIGAHGAVRYTDVTDITVTGGAAGDSITVKSEADRPLIL